MTKKQAAQGEQTDTEREAARVAALSDQQVLDRTGNGRFGPAIIGVPLHERAKKILKSSYGGNLGPAITDPDYDQKRSQALMRTRDDRINGERRLAALARDGEQSLTGLDTVEIGEEPDKDTDLNDADPDDIDSADNPWNGVTLSGAKHLAQQNGVSYKPRIKRTELIQQLRAAGVRPPEPSDDEPDDDEE